jgi:tetratricopeptide (TPR) repeat protein
LKAYSLAESLPDCSNSIPLYQQAVRLDPNFASAYNALGDCYNDLGDGELASENSRKAYELRERVSEKEKLIIETAYYFNVTGDLKKARQSAETQSQLYPREAGPLGELSYIDYRLGQYERSLSELEESQRRKPMADNYPSLINGYIVVGQFEKAKAVADEALAKGFDSPYLRYFLYCLAFVQGDESKMQQQVAWSIGRQGAEDVLLEIEGWTAVYYGRLGKAREYFQRSVKASGQSTETETRADHLSAWCYAEALLGNPREARKLADAALKGSRNRTVRISIAAAMALLGDNERAKTMLDELATEFPEDTQINVIQMPAILAQISLNKKDPLRAIELLQNLGSYEFANLDCI